MQLVAYGAQDIYLTGNPQITYFKIVYRRYTNFAIEIIEHPFDGCVGFGNSVSAKIAKNGDLINKMYLKAELGCVNPGNSKFAWVRRVGHAMIKNVDVEIGGTKIDKQYGVWLDIWYELARQGDHERGYAHMVGDIPILTDYNNCQKPCKTLYVPLQFWFNRFIGLSIPLIALQYHEVIIHFTLEKSCRLYTASCDFNNCEVFLKDATLLVNYVYLDTDERRRFATVGHEYLIEQLQFNGGNSVVRKQMCYPLDFNFPTEELIWAVRCGNYCCGKRFIYYTGNDCWSIEEASLWIIQKSVVVGFNPANEVGGCWKEVCPKSYDTVGRFNIVNKLGDRSVYVNPDSLSIGDYGITSKICADIVVKNTGIHIYNIESELTIADLSISVDRMCDTRYGACDPVVNIFGNYGVFIDGSCNPVSWGLLQFNGYERFDRREGMYFNYIQPYQSHSNVPRDGINCYSFALYPEEHQPSGTANFSRLDTAQLTLWFYDCWEDYFCGKNKLYIFAVNYNIFRILSGLSGIAYQL